MESSANEVPEKNYLLILEEELNRLLLIDEQESAKQKTTEEKSTQTECDMDDNNEAVNTPPNSRADSSSDNEAGDADNCIIRAHSKCTNDTNSSNSECVITLAGVDKNIASGESSCKTTSTSLCSCSNCSRCKISTDSGIVSKASSSNNTTNNTVKASVKNTSDTDKGNSANDSRKGYIVNITSTARASSNNNHAYATVYIKRKPTNLM